MMQISRIKLLGMYLIASMSFATLLYGFNSAHKLGLLVGFSKNLVVFGYLVIGVLLLYGTSKKLKISTTIIGCAIIGLMIVLTDSLTQAFLVMLMCGSFYLYGNGFYALMTGQQKLDSALIFSILVGLSLVGMLVSAMSFLPIGYPGVYLLLVMVPYVIFTKDIIKLLKKPPNLISSSSIVDAGLVTITTYYLMIALMPEIGHDALAMHLFVPSLMESAHYWSRDVENYSWAVMPMLGDWVYSVAYMIGGEKSVRFTNFLAILLFSWLSGVIASWACDDNKVIKITALFILCMPIIFAENSSSFIDSIWAVLVLGSVLLVLQVNEKNYVNKIFLFTIISAGALSAKATSISLIFILTLLLFLRVLKFAKISKLKWMLCASTLILIFGFSPYIYSWYLTGNPVFPFFNGVFKSHFFPIYNFQPPFQPSLLTPYEIYRMTFFSQEYIEGKFGATGFQLISLLPVAIAAAIVAKNTKAVVVMSLGLLFITITFLSTGYIRYILPSFGIIVGGIFGALNSKNILVNKKLKLVFNFLIILTIILNLIFLKAATNYGDFKFGAVVSKDGRKDYLYHHQPIRLAVDFVNSININHSATAFFSSPLAAGLTADALHPNWYNSNFSEEITNAISVSKLLNVLLKYKVKYIIFDENWGDLNKRKNILSITTKIATFNTISVLRIKDNYLYQDDILEGKGSKYSWLKWNNFNSSIFLNDRIDVSQKTAIHLVINIQPNVQYLNRAKVSCSNAPALGRLQVTWLDIQKKNIKSDLRVISCSDEVTTEEMVIDSPSNARYAIVYATGHEQVPISFYDMQFLGP